MKSTIRRILREERNNYEMFIIRRFNIIDKILKEELKDQEPCYWKYTYRNMDPENGLDRYFRTVVRAVAERTLDIFPEYYREHGDEEYRIYDALLYTIKTMFGQEIEEYYNNEDCSTYYNLNESILREETENRGRSKLIKIIKNNGFNTALNVVGTQDNIIRILDVKTPMELLDMFNDLKPVRSVDHPSLTLYRYKEGNNIFAYYKKNNEVYINYNLEYLIRDGFDLTYFNTRQICKEWLEQTYGLKVIHAFSSFPGQEHSTL